MLLSGAFILCVCVSAVFADEEAAAVKTCTNPDKRVDGYTLLAPNSTFRLTRTTFSIQTSNTYRCISATVDAKEEDVHEVTLTVEYDVEGTGTRDGYSQRFQFHLQEGTDSYNVMESAGTIGAPAGSYIFLATEPSCIVLEATAYDLPKDGFAVGEASDSQHTDKAAEETDAPHAEARTLDKADQKEKRGRCLLWVRDDEKSSGAPDACCLHMFGELCAHEEVRQSFSGIQCRAPAAETAPEQQAAPSSQ
uniref:Putative lipocalin-6 1 n=1 Tax=Amblyomma triste TaxID=251400 RepID=A0A023GDU3_AMBTT